jgi:hypothetical protein
LKQEFLQMNTVVCDINPMDESQLTENIEKIKNRCYNAVRSDTEEHFWIAKDIEDLCNAGDKQYGAGVMKKLAEATGYSEEKLRQSVLVARSWPPEEMKTILLRKNKFGMPITWSHLTTLAQIKSKSDRDAFLEDVLSEGLSVRKLKEKCKGQNENDEEIAEVDEDISMEEEEDCDPDGEGNLLMKYYAEFDVAEEEDRSPEEEEYAKDGTTEDLAPEPSAAETKGDHVRNFDSCLRRLIGATDGATENVRNLWSKLESLLQELDSEQITGDRRLQIEKARDKLCSAAEFDKKAAQALDDSLKQEEPVAEQVTVKRPARRTKSSAA